MRPDRTEFRDDRWTDSGISTVMLRGPVTILLVAAAALLASYLAPALLVKERERSAIPEKMTSERLRSFIEEHSWLDYTTQGGETLEELARRLRLGDPGRIRSENPHVSDFRDDQPLDPGIVLTVRYNYTGAGVEPAMKR